MKKLVYLVIILILIGAGFYLWQNRHDYFFQGNEPYEMYNEEMEKEGELSNDILKKNEINKEEYTEDDQGVENNDVSNEITTVSGNEELLDLLENHCPNKCEAKEGSSDYDYCMEICGFRAVDSSTELDCEKNSDNFKKDSCYKNKAISEKNSEICNSISDNRLKDNCKDRVIEEIFN